MTTKLIQEAYEHFKGKLSHDASKVYMVKSSDGSYYFDQGRIGEYRAPIEKDVVFTISHVCTRQEFYQYGNQ